MAFAQLEPFGDERADLRMGIETSALVRLWADPKKARDITPATFMPYLQRAPKLPKTVEQMRSAFDRLTARHVSS